MKTKHLLLLLIQASLAACTVSEGGQPIATEERTPLRLSTLMMPATRAATDLQSTAFAFSADRKAGVHVYRAGYAADNDGYGETNQQVTSVTSGILNTATPLYFPLNKEAVDVYVYAPYVNGATLASTALTVQADQSSNDAYLASDLVVGCHKNVAYGTTPQVPLYHAMTKLLFEVPAKVRSVKILSVLPTVTVSGLGTAIDEANHSLYPASVGASGTAINITALTETAADAAATTAACILPPQAIAASTVQIEVTLGTQTSQAYIPAVTLLPGKVYTLRVTTNVSDVPVDASVGGWGDGGTIDESDFQIDTDTELQGISVSIVSVSNWGTVSEIGSDEYSVTVTTGE